MHSVSDLAQGILSPSALGQSYPMKDTTLHVEKGLVCGLFVHLIFLSLSLFPTPDSSRCQINGRSHISCARPSTRARFLWLVAGFSRHLFAAVSGLRKAPSSVVPVAQTMTTGHDVSEKRSILFGILPRHDPHNLFPTGPMGALVTGANSNDWLLPSSLRRAPCKSLQPMVTLLRCSCQTTKI